MSEHYERHRHHAEELAEFATGRGLPLSPERAYRAWIDHSESMAAGWIVHDTTGDDADITFAILEGAEGRLQDEDRALLDEESRDIDRLRHRAETLGLELTRETVAGAWADHSATQGVRWGSTDSRDVNRVLEACPRNEPEEPSFHP